MVIEDDEVIRAGLGELLAQQGYRVELLPNGRDALERLRSGPPPAVILLDLSMPVMSGWEFLDEKVKDPALAAIPVIVMSATGEPLGDSSSSCAAFVRKPFAFTQLLHILQGQRSES
ncbi:MAG: response regulator [Thermoanaerobaculia bacterium]